MPVSLESIGTMSQQSQQDRIDLEKIYADYPTEQRLVDVQKFVQDTTHCQWFAARFNARLLGALTLTISGHNATINHLCVRAITRKRHVGRDLLRLMIAQYPLLTYHLQNCLTDKKQSETLAQLMHQAGFSQHGTSFTLKP